MTHRHRWLIGIGAVLALALSLTAAGGQASLAVGDIIYVDADATGSSTGGDWTNAYTDLQAALEDAEEGDQLWVAAGTYKPSVPHGGTEDRYKSFQMANGVAIYGGFDPSAGATDWEHRDWVLHETILSGDIGVEGDPADNSYHVFYHAGGLDTTAILDGFTISGGNADGDTSPDRDGGGMYNDGSSPTLANLAFAGNSAGLYGGGIYNDESSPTLTGCTFTSNSATYGGGMANYLYATPEVTNCTFAGNTASQGGGGLFNGFYADPVLTNCTFWDNTATFGGGIYNHYSSPVVTNCTFAENSVADAVGGIHNTSSSAPVLTNCILWGDGSPEIDSDDSSSPDVTYSDIQGSYPGDGNLDADPLFVDPDNGDFHLLLGSPCIDAGNNSAPDLPGLDFEGDYRVLDGDFDGTAIVDMGVDEHRIAYYVDADAQGANNGSTWEDAFTTLQPALDLAIAGDEIWVAVGTYTPTAEHGGSGDRYRSFQLKNGVALYGGFDPSLGHIGFGHRDWEANPTILSGDLNGDDGPGFANNGENSYHVFYHPDGTGLDTSAMLDGFTITGGNANHLSARAFQIGGGMLNTLSSPALLNCTFSNNSAVAEGGGIYNWTSAPLLLNCTFSGNSASYGGGMNNTLSSPELAICHFLGNSAANEGGGMRNFTDSSPSLTNCSFDGNSAGTDGGGMLNEAASSPTLANCTFLGNSASADGGGIHNAGSSSPILTNCTFWDNSAGAQGGGIYNSSDGSPTLTNCILWGDTPSAIYNADDISQPAISYSDIQAGCTADPYSICLGGNINEDPLFMNPGSGDLHLSPGSPCIDTGDNYTPSLPVYDFEWDIRIMDGDNDGTATVDMGVDEALWLPVYLPVVLKGY